jgi:adenosylhomocysteine nucleosidase
VSVPARLGIVVGYRAEAECLTASGLRMACSGADAGRARAAAMRLRSEGVAGLVSFGLAGGLIAALAPGDLLLPEAVILPHGDSLAADPAWRARLAAILERAGLHPRDTPIAASEHLVATPAAKAALVARSGAAAVDMESAGVAAVAAEAGLPFLVLRAVADRSDQGVPRAARAAIDDRGEIRQMAVLAGVLRRPWEIVPLIGLGRSSARGLASLRRVAALAPGLGFV